MFELTSEGRKRVDRNDAVADYCILSGSAEALVRCGGKLLHLLIAYFLGNTCAKHYENPTMLTRVTANNVGFVFFETQCRNPTH